MPATGISRVSRTRRGALRSIRGTPATSLYPAALGKL
jgi:hypothetical protein